MTDLAIAAPERRTPWHVWAVGIAAVIWNGFGAMDYLMTQTRNEQYMSQFTPEQLEYFYAFPAWVVACWAIAVWGALLGSVLLLMRRRLAVPVFLVALVAFVLTAIYNYVLSAGLEVMGDAFSLAFTGVIFVVSVALYLYARAMQKRGVLV
jgi:hypothetical protein